MTNEINKNITIPLLTLNNYRKEISDTEKAEFIDSIYDCELSPNQEVLLMSIKKLDMDEENINKLKQDKDAWTIRNMQKYVVSKYPNPSIKSLKDFMDGNGAVMALDILDNVTCITKKSDVDDLIKWANFVNTKQKHFHSSKIDTFLIDSAKVTLANLSPFTVKDSMNKVLSIMDAVSNNCSQSFIRTYFLILTEIDGSNLKSELKNNLYNECIHTFANAVNVAVECNLFSSFLNDRFNLISIVEFFWNKKAGFFEQSEFNTILNNIFNVYMSLMETYGKLFTDDIKWDVFSSLIPFDATNRRDIVVNNIYEKLKNNDIDFFTEHFSVAILKNILLLPENETSNSRDIKIKCAEILVDIFITKDDINKIANSELYIRDSLAFENQDKGVNAEIIKHLAHRYDDKDIGSELREKIYNLVADYFEKIYIQDTTQTDLLHLGLNVIISNPDSSRFKSSLEHFFIVTH